MGEAEKELRCEACGRVIKPERDEKVERVTDADGVERVFVNWTGAGKSVYKST